MQYHPAFQPWSISSSFARDLDRVFDRERLNSVNKPEVDRKWQPAVDISETKQAFVIDLEIPGVDPKSVEVTQNQNELLVSGNKVKRESEQEQNPVRVERAYGAFERRFKLPERVDIQGIRAKAENGVLTITIPKVAEVQPKKIAVQ